MRYSISAWGSLNLKSEFDYDKVGNMTASWSPRAFELQAGESKDDFKTAYETNELNQTWHVTSKYEVGEDGDSSLVSVDSYSYFDLNGNLVQSFREYIEDDGTAPTAPSDEDDPTTFGKATTAMTATWVESSATYNLLNYATSSTVDAVAGTNVTQYTSRTEFDSNYNVIASISPLGNRNHTVYDERDLTYQSIAGAESDVQATFETDYDDNGNTTAVRDALGNESTYVYDGFDRTTHTVDPAGNYSYVTYDANSNVLESSAYDALENLLAQSQTTYDEINRGYISKRMANDHLGNPIGDGWNTSTTVFDKNSRTVSHTNDNGVTSYMFYDSANRTTHTRDAVGNETHYIYNAHSATTRIDYLEVNGLTSAFEKSHVTYVLNRSDVAWEVQDRRWAADFDTSGYARRDGWGRVVEAVDAAGNSNTSNYDLLSRVTDSTEESGTDDIVTRFTYDDDSRTTQRAIKRNPIDSLYQETDFVYDERNRLITTRRPDGDVWQFFYDANSNRLGWLDPMGTRVHDTYDERNLIEYRMIERGSGIVGTDYESYEFDGLGRLTACSNYADGDLISASTWAYNTQSQPEQHNQTIADYQGSVLGNWTTGAEYDATGFNTATIYSDGRTVRHSKDSLDRLQESYDQTNGVTIASYIYRGPGSLVQRTYGNGTQTNYTYESSGCGCGGSTQFIERIEHSDLSAGRVLWATDRRYDERGLVLTESRDHEGGYGVVHRYDEAERLTKTWYGVDNAGTNITTHMSTDPTTYGKRVDYDLDPRGNRDSVTEYDDAGTPNQIYDYSYTEDTNTNQYTAIDGNSFTFDAIEQMIFDPTRDLDFAYDYKGQVITEDRDNDTAGTPERRYTYDNQGRRRVEQQIYEGSEVFYRAIVSCYPTVCQSCGCSGSGAPTLETIEIDPSSSNVTNHVQSTFGPGAHGSLSDASTVNPLVAAMVSGGMSHGPARVLDLVTPDAGSAKWQYRYEDQLGSLVGMADDAAVKLRDFSYLNFGRPLERKIMFDATADMISSISADTPDTNLTEIVLDSTYLTEDELAGMAIAVPVPDDANDTWRVGWVEKNTGDTIWVSDPDAYGIYDAIWDTGNSEVVEGFVVYDFRKSVVTECETTVSDASYDGGANETTLTIGPCTYLEAGWLLQADIGTYTILRVESGQWVIEGDVTWDFTLFNPYTATRPNSGNFDYKTTGGTWDSAPSYASSRTTLSDTNANFASHMVGWMICLDADEFTYAEITDYVSTTSIKVKGDVTGLTASGERYWVFAPPHIETEHGTIDPDALCYSSKYLWAGYEYVTPMAGFYVDPPGASGLGVYGRQDGTNQAGWYYCWNRTYDPSTARWTTPDPAASPWTNLWSYCGANPLTGTDPSGLISFRIDDEECTITMEFTIQFFFDDSKLKWTKAEKQQYIYDAKEAIESAWDDKIVLKPARESWTEEVLRFERFEIWGVPTGCKPVWKTVTHKCPCQDGYKVRVDIFWINEGTSIFDDVEATVVKLKKGSKRPRSSAGTSSAKLNNRDVTSARPMGKYADGTTPQQVIIAHEFGHMIGLHHPNKGAANHDDEYNEKGQTGPNKLSKSIMGAGMEVRPEHVGKWKDELDDERSDCGPFTAHKK